MVGIAEDRREYCERSSVVEDRAKGDGRGLNRWEVCKRFISDALSFRTMPVKQHQHQEGLQVGSLMQEGIQRREWNLMSRSSWLKVTLEKPELCRHSTSEVENEQLTGRMKVDCTHSEELP